MIIELEAPAAPVEMLSRLAHLPHVSLLEGSTGHHELGRFSFLSADPVATITAPATEWPVVRETLRRTIEPGSPHDNALPPFQGGWMGWFSYELGTAFDRFPRAPIDDLHIPDIALALYDWVIAWDHRENRAWLISTGIDAEGEWDEKRAHVRRESVLDAISRRRKTPSADPRNPTVVGWGPFERAPAGFSGNFTPDAYRSAVARVIEHVLDGDIFQANLAQRFTAPFAGDPLALYAAMRRQTVAPMAAYIAHGDVRVLSASPERFLQYSPVTRRIETRPIKGTRRRDSDAMRDRALAQELEASEKDRAENVMIVDLLRNDLSRVANAGSVRVPALCRLESHPTVHHLVSIVEGTLRDGLDTLDLLAAAFPGGSITGAPKLRAAAIIAELEQTTRGVYCGAIGWIGLDGAMDTNIAIRTVTLASGIATLHAGGGVTALSDSHAEYQETIDKARALVAALADVA